MIVSRRTVRWLERAYRVEGIVRSVAALWPPTHVVNRAGEAYGHLIHGAVQILDGKIGIISDGWPFHVSPVLCAMVQQYGTKICTVPDAVSRRSARSDWTYWRLDPYDVIVWDSGGGFSSPASIEEIAAEVLLRAQVAGQCERLAVSSEGLTPDPISADHSVATIGQALIDQLRKERALSGSPPRSILLHGPAGSGKSVVARQIAAALADTVMVVDSSAISDGTNHQDKEHVGVWELLRIWSPGAVVLDDIDHVMAHEGDRRLIAGLDRLRASVPVVVGTANAIDELSGALARPGRFDRVVCVDAPDAALARAITVHVPPAVQEQAIACRLLVAYLSELDVRCRAGCDPAAALADLAARQVQAGDGLEAMRESARGDD